MNIRSRLAAALVLGAALAAVPDDSIGQTPPAAQPAAPAPAAQAPPVEKSAGFSPEQLEQLVAPIALYPDSLLTQTLMASTYPLEIVEASRWLKKNPSLKDKALEEALKPLDWDPSVKSLCAFPEVLNKMNENLDWMQDLGDAFLGQQQAVLETVQRMRAKAYESGNLKTTEQQKVTQTAEKVVIIEPASPEVIYVPTYSPTVVYGGWSYPTYYYPPMYAPYPPGAGLVTFTAGVAFGAAVWGNCDWGHHEVDIDVDRYNNFNRNTSVNADRYANRSGSANWEHNAEHRRGVNYQNTSTAQKYGGASGSKNVTRDQARGWSESRQPGQGGGAETRPGGGGREPGSRPSGGGERPTTLPSGGGREPGSRPSGGGERPTTLPSGGADRPSAGTADRKPAGGASAGTRDVPRPSGGSTQRPSTGDRSYASSGGSKNSAYSGSRSPSADVSASSRGSSSRGSSSYSGSKSSGASRPSSSSASRPPSGGSRPSGGGGGGRGGGGRR
jgi:hypothetical protein